MENADRKITVRQLNDIVEGISRIDRQVKLIKEGKTTTPSGVDRLNVINEKTLLIRVILNNVELWHLKHET